MKMPKQVTATPLNSFPSTQPPNASNTGGQVQLAGVLPQSAEDVKCECRNGILYCEMNKKWYKTNQTC